MSADSKPVKKSIVLFLTALCALAALVFGGVVYLDYQRFPQLPDRELSAMTVQQGTSEADGQVRFLIDSIDVQPKNVIIQGWLIKNNENMEIVNNRVLLRDTTDDSYRMMQTKMIDKMELEDVYGDEHAYRNGGFYSIVGAQKLVQGHSYEICLLYQSRIDDITHSNNILVLTGQMIEGAVQ
jgi:hypothetical protein